VARCPFHEGDREPSLTIYEETDTYYCFGCEAWGDAVKYLIDYRHLTPTQAMEYMGEEYKSKTRKNEVIKVTDVVSTWRLLYEITEQYHQYLLQFPGALNYLKNRGLTEETIARYQVGYTDGRVLSLKFASEVKIARTVGILNDSNNEVMSHRITIPNILDKGEVDFIIGRTVINDRVKYLGTRMPKPVFGFHEVRHSPVLFIAEGQFDWLILRQWGYPAAVLGGTHLPRYHQALLESKTLVIIPDQDDVGLKAATKLKERFDKAYILDMGRLGVKDVGELGMREDGEQIFDEIVKEQLSWFSTHMSKTVLAKWLPSLTNLVPSLST
jgi:DNA primase